MILQRALEGASRGRALLAESLDEAATAFAAIQARLRAAEDASIDMFVPSATRRVRVIATKLQLPDLGDPALVEGYLTATIRARVGDTIIGARTLQRVELASFEGRGAVIDLGLELAAAEVGPWESLAVEVLAGAISAQQPVDLEGIRFQDVLRDGPDRWIGEHVPVRSQAWRLWYRIEWAPSAS
jgi:hypothetical protein